MMGRARDLRPGALGVAFAAITATVFGLYEATRVRYGADIHASGVVWIIAWIVGAAVVGRVVARMPSTLHAVLVTVMIGLMSAMPVLAMWSSPIYSTRTIILFAFGVWPALLVLVALLGRRAERARSPSLIRGAYVRSLALVALSLIVGLAAFSFAARVRQSVVIGALGLGGLVCVVSAGVDVRALRRLGRPKWDDAGGSEHVIDYGVGDEERRDRVVAPLPSYRASAVERIVVTRGSISAARHALVIALAVALLAMGPPCLVAVSVRRALTEWFAPAGATTCSPIE